MNTQTYTVNIRTGVVNITRVDVSQGDTGRTLVFKLYDGLSPFTPPTGSTVTIVGRKPSKLGFSEACTVSGNVATVTTTLAMTQESGKIPVELRIESDTRSIGTANFMMHVEPSPHPTGTTDGTHATVDNLQTQIGNLANLTTTAKTNLVSAINEAAQSGSEVIIDDTLTQTGQAADAKKTGDEIASLKADLDDLTDRVEALESGGGGLTDAVKTALLQLAQKVAYIDDDGQDYYDNLYDALYPPAPPASLTSITAVYTQSGTVYDTDSLDDLKSDLVVTAHYSDSTSHAVTDYTLSGTLAAGTSVVSVSYSGKSTTFSVTVTAVLYPFENGTHTFTSYPQIIEVSAGNRAKVTLAQGNAKDIHANVSGVSKNTANHSSTDNYLNNGVKWFTIPGGATVQIRAKVNSVEVPSNSTKATISLRNMSGTSVFYLTSDILLKDLSVGDTIEHTETLAETTDIACLGWYMGSRGNSTLASLDLTFEVYVNGVKYV